MRKFFVLEGVDGSGKSTVAKLLEREGIRVLESPVPPFDEAKRRVLEEAAPLARCLFFLAANVELSDIVTRTGRSGTIVCVRYIWSTIAYHVALRVVTESEARAMWKMLESRIVLPDRVVFLEADEEERSCRLAARNESRGEVQLDRDERFQRGLASAYRFSRDLIPVPAIDVDTSRRLPEEVAAAILQVVMNRSA